MTDHDRFEDSDPALEALLRRTLRTAVARQIPDDRPVPAALLAQPARAWSLRRRWVGLSAVAAGLVAAGVAAALVGHEALDAAPRPTPAATGSDSAVLSTTPTTTPSPTTRPTGGVTTRATPTGSAISPNAPVGPSGGPVPVGFVPVSATFVSADDGWVLGTTTSCATAPCTSIVRTRDGGRTWVGIPAPRAELADGGTVLTDQVQSIRFADPLDGWVFGGQLWATHDGGTTWHQVGGVVTSGQSVADLEAGGGSVYLATAPCAPTSGSADPCSSTTSSVFAAAATSDAFAQLASVPYGTVHIAVHDAEWWISGRGQLLHGAGRHTPDRVANICAADQPAGLVTAADGSHVDGLCFGPGGAGGSTGAQLRGSTDGGRSWTDAGPGFRAPSGLFQLSDNGAGALLFAAASGASALFRTTDDGSSFNAVLETDAGGGTAWTDAGYTTATQAFAVLPGHSMYQSTDAGATWHTITFAR